MTKVPTIWIDLIIGAYDLVTIAHDMALVKIYVV